MPQRRHRRLSPLLATLIVASACAGAGVRPPGEPVSALAVDDALGAMTATPLWPGFQPTHTPIALFDGTRTWLFRHPSAPSGYVTVTERPGVMVREGRDSAVTANTSVPLGGVSTATVMLNPQWSASEAAAITVHELFHVYQRAHHPKWEANEADLFTYPVEDSLALALRREESSALRQAVDAPTPEVTRCWARAVSDARSRRFAAIGAAAAAYERGTELNEGLAKYVEHRAAGRAVRLAPGDFPVAQVRQRAYDVGAAIAAVLDRLQPEWRDRLEASTLPAISLDAVLADAVGPAEGVTRCGPTSVERAGWLAQAGRDVRDLLAERSRTRDDFLARRGWRLEVDASGAVFFPQRFDPLNLTRVSPTEILHGRYLTLQGNLGTVELLGGSALTEGNPGAHPLFAGVRRVTITGQRSAPTVRDSAGVLEIQGEGVRLRLRGARADTVGETIRLRRR
jgi:hypothetical protein